MIYVIGDGQTPTTVASSGLESVPEIKARELKYQKWNATQVKIWVHEKGLTRYGNIIVHKVMLEVQLYSSSP